MKRLILALLLTVPVFAQTNPVTAAFPGAVVTDDQLTYQDDFGSTTLSSSVGASDLTIFIASAAGFLEPSVIAVCPVGECSSGNYANAELMMVTGISGTTLTIASTGRSLGQDCIGSTTGKTFAIGSVVELVPSSCAHNRLAAEIKAIETALGANLANVAEVADFDTEAELETILTDVTNLIVSTEIDSVAELEALAGAVNLITSTEVDSIAELEALLGAVNVLLSTEVDTSAELAGVLGDETGTGAVVFNIAPNLQGVIDGTGTAVDDDDCTGQQGEWWFDSTDGRFEFCNADSGAPSVPGTASGSGDDMGAVDTEAELESTLSDVSNVFTNNDGSLDDDDLSDNDAGDLAVTPFSSIAATNVQAALEEIVAEATAGGATQLSELSDVGVTTPTAGNALMADGDSWEARPLVEADISDLGTYLTSEVNNLGSAVTWANIPDANVPSSAVTQHEAALEGVLDLQDLQGAATDAQVPNTITVDLAAVATTANAGDSATSFFSVGEIEDARLPSGLTRDAEWDTLSEINAATTDDDAAGLAAVQTFATGTKTVTAKFDFGGGTLEAPNGSSRPGTCVVGEVYFDSDETAGSNWYGCTASNTWTLLGGGSFNEAGDYEPTGTWDFSGAAGVTLPDGTGFGSGTTPFNLTGYTDDVAPSAPGTANQFTAYVDRASGLFSWIVNGGSAQTAVTLAGTQTLTSKTLTTPTINNPVLSTDSYATFTEMTAPASPSANDARLYAKDDGGTTKVCMKDSAGTETCIGDGIGGGSADLVGSNNEESFTAQTSVVIEHSFGHDRLITTCYDGSGAEVEAASKTIGSGPAYDVTVTFAIAQTGRCVVSGGGSAGYTWALVSQTAPTLTAATHLLGANAHIEGCYDGSGNRVEPGSESRNGSGDLSPTFAVAFTGDCEVRP